MNQFRSFSFYHLPHSATIIGESKAQLERILERLKCFQEKDATKEEKAFWIRSLKQFIQLKEFISASDSEILIKILLQLALKEQDYSTQTKCINVLLDVLNLYDRYNLRYTVNPDFQINWRDLFEVLDKTHINSSNQYIGKSQNRYHLHYLKALIHTCRKYFLRIGEKYEEENEKIVKDILELFFNEQVCINMIEDFDLHFRQGLAALFLPTRSRSAYEILIPFIISKWKIIENCVIWDINWMWILSRISEHTCKTHSFGMWNQHVISEIFTHTIKELDLANPNDRNKPPKTNVPAIISEFSSPSAQYDYDLMRYISKIIANTFSPETSTLESYIQLIDLISSYFHPSNGGGWSSKLGNLISLSAQYLEIRIANSKTQSTPQNRDDHIRGDDDDDTQDDYHLTREIIQKFVSKTLEVAILGVYSKHKGLQNSSHSCIKSLCWIAPEIVLPALLEKLGSGLTTLTASHQTETSLMTLSYITPIFVNPNQFPDGPTYLYSLLENSLPGIDTNDLSKTSAALFFFFTFFSSVPLVDLSKNNDFDDSFEVTFPNCHNHRSIDSGDTNNNNGGDGETIVAQSHEMKEISHSLFENFAILFIERMILFFGNICNVDDPEFERLSFQLTEVLNNFVLHLSPEIFSAVLTKVFNYVTNHIVENAKFEFSTLLNSLSRAYPRKTFELFLPYFLSQIPSTNEGKVSRNRGENENHSNHSSASHLNESCEADSKLEWDMIIFFGILNSLPGDILRSYLTPILQFSGRFLVQKDQKLLKYNNRLLFTLLFRLSSNYIVNYRYYNDTEVNQIRWGKLWKLEEIHTSWFIPTSQDITLAVELLTDLYSLSCYFLLPIFEECASSSSSSSSVDEHAELFAHLKEYTQRTEQCKLLRYVQHHNPDLSTKEKLNRALGLLKCILDGGDLLFHSENIYAKSPIEVGKSMFLYPTSIRSNEESFKAFEPLLDMLYIRLGEILRFLHGSIIEKFDDVSIQKYVVSLIGRYIQGTSCFFLFYDQHSYFYSETKKKFRTHLYDPRTRGVMNDSARSDLFYTTQISHVLKEYYHRINHCKYSKLLTPLHRALFDDLFSLCCHQYVQIREKAQRVFRQCLKQYPQQKKHYLLKLLNIITLPVSRSPRAISTKEINQWKGALYLLNSKLLNEVISSWRLQYLFIKAILGPIFTVDNDSIQKLLHSLILFFNSQYYPLPLRTSSKDYSHYYTSILHIFHSNMRAFNSEVNTPSSSSSPSISWKLPSTIGSFLFIYQSRHDVATENTTLKWFFDSMISDLLPLHTIALSAIPSLLKVPSPYHPSILYRAKSTISPAIEQIIQDIHGVSQSSSTKDYFFQYNNILPCPLSSSEFELLQLLRRCFLEDEKFFEMFLRNLAECHSHRVDVEDMDAKVSNFVYSMRSSLRTRLNLSSLNLAKQLTFDISHSYFMLNLKTVFPLTKGKLLEPKYSLEICRFFCSVYSLLIFHSKSFDQHATNDDDTTISLISKRLQQVHSSIFHDIYNLQIEEEERSRLYCEIYAGVFKAIMLSFNVLPHSQYVQYWDLLNEFSQRIFHDNNNNNNINNSSGSNNNSNNSNNNGNGSNTTTFISTEIASNAHRFALNSIAPQRYAPYLFFSLFSFDPLSDPSSSSSSSSTTVSADTSTVDWLGFLNNSNISSQKHVKKLTCISDLITEANHRLLSIYLPKRTEDINTPIAFTEGLLLSIIEHIDHPSLPIREALSRLLYLIFCYCHDQPTAKPHLLLFLQLLLQHIQQKEAFIINNNSSNNNNSNNNNNLAGLASSSTEIVQRRSYFNTLGCVVMWIGWHFYLNAVNPLEEYLDQILPLLFKCAISYEKDLSLSAKACIASFQCFQRSTLITKILPVVISPVILQSTHWRSRECALPFLQVVIFYHRFRLSEDELQAIHQSVIPLLCDPQLEVRNLAMICLSSILRGSSSSYLATLAIEFQNLACPRKSSLKRSSPSSSTKHLVDHDINHHSPPHNNKLSDSSSNNNNNINNSGDENNSNNSNHSINSSHSRINHIDQLKRFLRDVPNPRFVGVLGLISLVNVAPYDIPDWFPRVLLSLIPHLDAPQRISNFVRKALQEFWRTHSDMWDVFKERFTFEELNLLNEASISPSYYT